jgi:hypothetical protein
MTRNPSKEGHFVYPLLSDKLRTYVKHSLYTDRVIFRAGPKELFASKEIRTLDLMEKKKKKAQDS